jgi:hypothetical protein
MPFADLHSDIGGPTASLLAKFQLPTSLEEKAHHFVPLLPAVRFATAAQHNQGLSEIAFRAAQLTSFEHLSEVTRTRIRHAPTLLVALQHACRWASLEDTTLQLWLEPCGESINMQQAHRNGRYSAPRDIPVAAEHVRHTHCPSVRWSKLVAACHCI